MPPPNVRELMRREKTRRRAQRDAQGLGEQPSADCPMAVSVIPGTKLSPTVEADMSIGAHPPCDEERQIKRGRYTTESEDPTHLPATLQPRKDASSFSVTHDLPNDFFDPINVVETLSEDGSGSESEAEFPAAVAAKKDGCPPDASQPTVRLTHDPDWVARALDGEAVHLEEEYILEDEKDDDKSEPAESSAQRVEDLHTASSFQSTSGALLSDSIRLQVDLKARLYPLSLDTELEYDSTAGDITQGKVASPSFIDDDSEDEADKDMEQCIPDDFFDDPNSHVGLAVVEEARKRKERALQTQLRNFHHEVEKIEREEEQKRHIEESTRHAELEEDDERDAQHLCHRLAYLKERRKAAPHGTLQPTLFPKLKPLATTLFKAASVTANSATSMEHISQPQDDLIDMRESDTDIETDSAQGDHNTFDIEDKMWRSKALC